MTKKKRPRNNTIYNNISLTLEKEFYSMLEKKVNETDDKNMSRFIEENVIKERIKKMPKRRRFKGSTIKKNFTFSEKFVEKIKKTNNMSLYVEQTLLKKFFI